MTQQDLHRRVTEWLVAEAPSHAAPRVLTGALQRAAQVEQGRPWGRSGTDQARILRWAVAAALLLAVVAGVAAVGAWLMRGTSPLPVSATNGWIAFTEAGPTRPDRGRLLLVRDGVDVHALTGPEGTPLWASCATFSPDGSRLAFTEWPVPRSSEEGRPVIVGIDGDGLPAGPRIELPARPAGACPRWSPDGTAILFAGIDGLLEGRLDGSVRALPGWQGRSATVGALDWSPDGSAALVTAADGIWIVPIGGGEARRLTIAVAGEEIPAGYKVGGARWSSDGRVAIPVRDGSVSSIRIQAASGEGVPIQLDGNAPLAWSRDGRRLAWVRPAVAADGIEVVVGGGDGNAPRVTARFEAHVRALAWSPDGTRLVIAVDPGGPTGRLIAVPVDGSGAPAMLTGGSHWLEWTTSDDLSWQAGRP